MSEPFEWMYFNWLCAKVERLDRKRPTTPSNKFDKLLKMLYETEFVWLLSGDDNRADDGLDLRREFLIAGDFPDDIQWRTIIGCSVLEMMIAFSRRTEFHTDIPAVDWFWEFLEKLELDQFTDSAIRPDIVEDILDRLIWRTYSYDGYGGMFPLETPHSDQREVEIWYQFCAYLMEQERLP